jgi:hypothetical protein
MSVEYPTPLFATDSEADRFGSPLLLRDWYTYNGKTGVEYPRVWSTQPHCPLPKVRPTGPEAHHRCVHRTHATGKG